MKAVTPLPLTSGQAANGFSVMSKRRPANETVADGNIAPSAFRREMPMTRGSDFVDIDGKRYFFDAPRGTYLNIVV